MTVALHLPSYKALFMTLLCLITVQSAISVIMRYTYTTPSLFAALTSVSSVRAQSGYGSSSSTPSCNASNATVDLNWNPPVKSNINNLATVINGTGIYGFIFNSSQGPLNTYNWCNMPHTNPATYPKVKDSDYKLEYVEVIHRHHKRTPYAANTFPVESYSWYVSELCMIGLVALYRPRLIVLKGLSRRRSCFWWQASQPIWQFECCNILGGLHESIQPIGA